MHRGARKPRVKTFRCKTCWLDPDYSPQKPFTFDPLVFEDDSGRQITGKFSRLRRMLRLRITDRCWTKILIYLMRGKTIRFPIDIVLTYIEGASGSLRADKDEANNER